MLEDILKFLSGSSKIPATGFDATPRINFVSEQGSRLPSVSTCSLTITFPRQIGLLTYESFEELMDLSILGSFGFGTV